MNSGIPANIKAMILDMDGVLWRADQPLGGAQGQASDIEIQAREILRLKSRLNKIMSESTGQTLEVIERDTERDFYLDAYQAVDYGLVDKVLEPPAEK